MSSFEKTILKLFAKTVLTEKVLLDFPLEKIHFDEKVEFSLSHHAPFMRWLVKIGLWLFQLASFFFYLKPFTSLNADQQITYSKKWIEGRSYFCYLFIRPLLLFVYASYYSDPDVSEKLGFREPTRAPSPGPSLHSGPPSPSRGERPKEVPVGGWGAAPRCIGEGDPVKDLQLEVEICVIGSGAGGAVVAKELAEKGHDVLILEEGGQFSLEQIRQMTTMERNTLLYRDAGLFTTIGVPPILVPTGKGVGGTTLINSGTCFRTPEKVFERWRHEFGLAHLSSTSMDPYFKKVEKILQVEKVADAVLGKSSSLIEQGLKKLGLHGEALYRNAPGCQGSGVCIFGCPTGAKQSMERSYLPLAFQAGAKLRTHCRVLKLHSQSGRVYKIDAVCGKQKLTIYPRKVVVACGTLQTPLLLKRSHIGRESGQLGRNLTIHPTAKVMGVFDEVVDAHRGVPQAYGMSDYQSEGMMFESVFFPPWLLATSIFHAREKHFEIMQKYRYIAIFGFLVHDESRGRVIEAPDGRPLVFYSLKKKEIEIFAKGLKILSQILFAAGAKKVYPTLRTVHEMNSEADLTVLDPKKIRRRDLETAAFHPLGSCRMGADPKKSVVDPNLRVHDFENLWVVDGSVFPTSLGVNPQMTIMAFATKCADEIHYGELTSNV